MRWSSAPVAKLLSVRTPHNARLRYRGGELRRAGLSDWAGPSVCAGIRVSSSAILMSRQISLWNPSRSASLVSSAGCRRTPGAGAGEVSFSGRHSGRRSVTVVSGPRREGLAVPAVGDFAKTYDLVARIGALSEVAVGPHVRSFNPARGSCQCRASSSSAIAARARELSSVHRRVRAVRAVGQRSCCRRRRARRRAPRGTRVRDLPWRVRRGRARQAPGVVSRAVAQRGVLRGGSRSVCLDFAGETMPASARRWCMRTGSAVRFARAAKAT